MREYYVIEYLAFKPYCYDKKSERILGTVRVTPESKSSLTTWLIELNIESKEKGSNLRYTTSKHYL
jgi:hypothetical protein